MSQFETSEVMMEYVKLVTPNEPLQKEAILPAIPAGIILAGKVIGFLLSLYSAYEVGNFLYRYFIAAYNSVTGLIDNIKALDPNELAAPRVEEWIKTLEAYADSFKLPPTTTDKQQMLLNLQSRVLNLGKLLAYLKQMQAEWPEVKDNLDDLFFDKMQAERSLTATVPMVESLVSKLEADLKSAQAKAIQEKGTGAGVDYTQVAKELIALKEQIDGLVGRPAVVFDNQNEQRAFTLAQAIVSEKATPQMIDEYGGIMVGLLAELKKKLPSAQQYAQRMVRRQSAKPAISKRALRLVFEQPKANKPVAARNPDVKLLQNLINKLNVIHRAGLNRIAEDGVFGNETNGALISLTSKIEGLEDALARVAFISMADLHDPRLLKSNPQYIQSINKALNYMLEKAGVFQEQAEDPERESILNKLRSVYARDPVTQEEMSLFAFLQGKNYDPDRMVQYIKRKFPRPEDLRYWLRDPQGSWPEIYDDFKPGRYSLT